MAQRLPNPAKVRKDPEAFHRAALKCCEEIDEFASLSPSQPLSDQPAPSLPFGGHFALRLRAKQVSTTRSRSNERNERAKEKEKDCFRIEMDRERGKQQDACECSFVKAK